MNLEMGKVNGVPQTSLDLKSIKENQTEKKFWHIDKKMIRFKLHYFLFSGGLGAISPFIPAFAQKQLKLSATSFATVVVSMQIMQSLSQPFIGFIVDYFNKLKVVVCVVIVCLVLLFFVFFSLPTIPLLTSNRERSNSSLNHPVCQGCNVSKLDSDILNEKNESSYYSIVENKISLKIISNIPCSNYQAFNFSDISSSCYFNGSVFKLEDKRLFEDMNMDENNTLSMSSCSTHLNEMNTSCALHIPDCSLCCSDFSACYLNLSNVSETSSLTTETASNNYLSYQFWLFACVFIAMYSCINCLFVLSATACCESVQKTGADFGKQRMFGPIGWGVMSVVGGILSDYTRSYLPGCAVLAGMFVGLLWNIHKIDFVKANYSKTFFKDIGTSFLSKDFVAFEIGALVNGIGQGAIAFYLVWFLMTIGGNNILVGLVYTVQNLVGDLPFMFFAGWLIRNMGHIHITTLSLLSHCIRFLFLGYLQNPWYVLLMEWTHGIYYGLYYVTLASYAKMSAKPGTETTMQGILFMTYDGLGTAIGNVVTGISIDYFGGHQTFYYAGIFFGCFTLISFCYTQLCSGVDNRFKKTSKIYVINK